MLITFGVLLDHLPSQHAAPEACDQMRLDGVDGDNCNAARHGAILA